jgi:hypothetical protein
MPGKIAPTGGGGGGGFPKDSWIETLNDANALPNTTKGGPGGSIDRRSPRFNNTNIIFPYNTYPSPGVVDVRVENPSNGDISNRPKSVQEYNTFIGLGGYGGGWDPGTTYVKGSLSSPGYGRNSADNEVGTWWKPSPGNKYGGGGGGGKAGIAGNHRNDDLKGAQNGAQGAHGVVVIIQEG